MKVPFHAFQCVVFLIFLSSNKPCFGRFVKPGDKVAEFDKICEVQSDKASVEITSRFDGVVKTLHYKVGDMSRVGQPLIDIETESGEENANGSTDVKPVVVTNSHASSTSPGKREAEAVVAEGAESNVRTTLDGVETLATPAVRRIARENKIDLREVIGTGKGGRVTKEDVLKFVGNVTNGSSGSSALPAAAVEPARPTEENQKLTGHQRAMFKQMTRSLTIPHFGYSDEVELDALTTLRGSFNDRLALANGTWTKRYPNIGKKVSYLPFFIKALSLALTAHPILNAQLIIDADRPQDPEKATLRHRTSHNIGIAMDTPMGLLVPNIKDAQRKSILEIADDLGRLQGLATRGALGPADLTGGTISLSNIGTVGGTILGPVVVSTELCIAALGRMRRLPRYENVTVDFATGRTEERIVPKRVMDVSWSADHRVVDGATLARFNELWRSYIQDPASMLSEMR